MNPNLSDIWKNRIAILKGVGNTVIKRKVIEEIAKKRLSICNSCPSKNLNCNIKDCCGICGCNLGFKTRSLESSCPQQKWTAVNIKS